MGFMWIFLEAGLALLILVAIVWWTMFAGRSKGEIQGDKSASLSAEQERPLKH
jgi:cytoskeletal protein RodZ